MLVVVEDVYATAPSAAILEVRRLALLMVQSTEHIYKCWNNLRGPKGPEPFMIACLKD